jgi:outer membrane protein assembly factor BamB
LSNATTDVLQHHNNLSKDGLYVDPLFTQAAAANTHRDTAFDAVLPGQVYAQPLYVQNGPGGAPAIIVATEENAVLAVDAATGKQAWRTDLPRPANRSQLPCGNINPRVGVTGTPVIDLDSRTIYVAANTNDGTSIPRHMIYALSIDDGLPIDGWPVDVAASVSFGGLPFQSTPQNQRGALLLLNGYLYVPYGGHYGDCGNYHGWVVAVPVADPSSPTAFATDARGGGIWAPAGLSSDGTSVFATTGNTFGTAMVWQGGEAVFRLGDGSTFSGDTADYFAPANWYALDTADADIGGVAAVPVSVAGALPSELMVAVGKNGVAYLLDRANLGGIGGELTTVRIANSTVINAPATFTTASGTFVSVASSGSGIGCPGVTGNLITFQIGATSPPSIAVAWCTPVGGRYSPIITTTDGSSEAVLWTISSGLPNRLRAYDAETGTVLFDGGSADEAIGPLKNFLAPIAVNGRIYVAGDDRIYAFTTQ